MIRLFAVSLIALLCAWTPVDAQTLKFTNIDGTVIVGTFTEDGSYPAFVAGREFNEATDASGHGFQDGTIFARGTGTSQYNSFYSYAALSGKKPFAHLRGGQMYLRNLATEMVDEITGYLSQPRLYTGSSTTEINHYYVAAALAMSGSPSVGTEYGLRIGGGPLLGTNTWAIYSTWAAPSYLAGSFTTGGPLTVTTSSTPSSSAACTVGTISWDANYIYVCTASGATKRAALTGGY